MSCEICTEKFNKASRKQIDCLNCDFKCCFGCFKRYTLEAVDEAHCMSCKAAIPFEYLAEKTPKTFYNSDYRKHRANISIEREKALLPETQPFVAQKRQDDERKARLLALAREKRILMERVKAIRLEEREINALQMGGEFDHLVEREHGDGGFKRGCADSDCRGFVDSKGVCGMCQKTTCKRCLELKLDGHECLEENIATAQLLKKEAKPCPGCGINISRISGCAQMWCTQCKVAFDWNSGKQLSGLIHNPHFHQWQRENRAANAENHCRDFIPYWVDFLGEKSISAAEREMLADAHVNIIHTERVEIPRFRVNDELPKRELRVKYLMKEIDEKQWVSRVQAIDKKNAKSQDIHNLLFAYTRSAGDLFWREREDGLSAEDLITQFWALEEYVNEQLELIQNRYNSVEMMIEKGKLKTGKQCAK